MAMTNAERQTKWRNKLKAQAAAGNFAGQPGPDAAEVEALKAKVAELGSRLAARPDGEDDLPEDMKAKFDRAVKKQVNKKIRELQDAFHEALKDEVGRFVDSCHADWMQKVRFAETYAGGRRHEQFPFTRDQFRLIRNCLHTDRLAQLLPPDAQLDEATGKRYNEAFALFNSKEETLVMPVPPTGKDPFPKTPKDLWEAAEAYRARQAKKARPKKAKPEPSNVSNDKPVSNDKSADRTKSNVSNSASKPHKSRDQIAADVKASLSAWEGGFTPAEEGKIRIATPEFIMGAFRATVAEELEKDGMPANEIPETVELYVDELIRQGIAAGWSELPKAR